MRRWVHSGTSVGILLLFACLARLTPHAIGYGTHTDLGLPACFFRTLTGVPCPSCGLTTSFVYLLHREWLAAWHANASGPLIFCVMMGVMLANFYGVIRPFAWGPIVATRWFHRTILCGIGWMLGTWIIQLVTGSFTFGSG